MAEKVGQKIDDMLVEWRDGELRERGGAGAVGPATVSAGDPYARPAPDLVEALAAYAHEAWSGWMEYLFESGGHTVKNSAGGYSYLLDPECEARWRRQMHTPYTELSAKEQESDREQARKILAVLADAGPAEVAAAVLSAEDGSESPSADAPDLDRPLEEVVRERLQAGVSRQRDEARKDLRDKEVESEIRRRQVDRLFDRVRHLEEEVDWQSHKRAQSPGYDEVSGAELDG